MQEKTQFRRKPTIIEATQFKEGIETPGVFKGEFYTDPADIGGRRRVEWYYVVTIHGQKTKVVDGDWIITEPDGIHHYPCKPDIFEQTYVEASQPPVNGEGESDEYTTAEAKKCGELIDKHIGRMSQLEKASVQHFIDKGTINGSFRLRLLAMMQFYRWHIARQYATEQTAAEYYEKTHGVAEDWAIAPAMTEAGFRHQIELAFQAGQLSLSSSTKAEQEGQWYQLKEKESWSGDWTLEPAMAPKPGRTPKTMELQPVNDRHFFIWIPLVSASREPEGLKWVKAGVPPDLVDGKSPTRWVKIEENRRDGTKRIKKGVAYYFPEGFKQLEFEDWDDYDEKDYPWTINDVDNQCVWLKAGWYAIIECNRCDGYWSAPLNVVEWLDETGAVKEAEPAVDPVAFDTAMEVEINKLPYTKHLDDGMYNDGQLAGFERGANWAKQYFESLNKQQ